jgi:hypothetical protein
MVRHISHEAASDICILISEWRRCFPPKRDDKPRKGWEQRAAKAEAALHAYLLDGHFGEINDWCCAAIWVDALCEPGKVHYREITPVG